MTSRILPEMIGGVLNFQQTEDFKWEHTVGTWYTYIYIGESIRIFHFFTCRTVKIILIVPLHKIYSIFISKLRFVGPIAGSRVVYE